MADKYVIYPAVGVARVGNLDGVGNGDFFLAPDAIGALPRDCDEYGNEPEVPNVGFSGFKNDAGQIKRQAQKFKVYHEDSGQEIIVNDDDCLIDGKKVESLEWTVHLANKKAEWYGFSEQKGNLLYGTANSYEAQYRANPADPEDPEYLRLSNSTVIPAGDDIPVEITPPSDRHELLIDPGPRTISTPNSHVPIDRDSIPVDYTHGHFPPTRTDIGDTFQGAQIDKLGDLITDDQGRLLVLGGLGKSQGQIPLDSYGGADTWYDDISDGSVTCVIKLEGQEEPIEVAGKAWVIVGPPDFAPELVNITSWDDTTFDVGVRYKGLVSHSGGDENKLDMYDKTKYSNPDYPGYNPNFLANYERDILPIIQRISGYQWVANVQSMSAFFSNLDDLDVSNHDRSDETTDRRKEFFKYFRKPELPVPIDGNAVESYPSVQYEVFENQTDPNIPLMPLNSGSNSVSNYNIKKFMALTQTQHFLLRQWAYGSCTDDATPYQKVEQKNRASVGNVVGLPQCPGIEVTWTTQNPAIYEEDDAYRIKHADSSNYFTSGLSVGAVDISDGTITDFSRDECETADGTINGESFGCQPGDLTKRMAIPWQADFFNCTIQYVNFSDLNTNKVYESELENGSGKKEGKKGDLVPKPPTYYSYWWPPQAPWDVLGGDHTVEAQALSGIPAGLQVNYMRGINSYGQMVNEGWSYLAFIRNQNANDANYPYFVETERDHDMFTYDEVSMDQITNRPDDSDTSIQVFYLTELATRKEKMASRMRALNLDFVEDLFKEITIAKSYRNRAPRSGTKVRF